MKNREKLTFVQQLIKDNFKMIIGVLLIIGFTGGFGLLGTSYFSSAQTFALVQSLILKAEIKAGVYD